MSTQSHKSDLIDCVHHEHQHLRRLFEDLQTTFKKIASGEVEFEPGDDILETAAEDLAVALDDMLHHFNQEEEVFFVDIEKRFPELRDDVARLVAGHEFMCERTKWLQQELKRSQQEIIADIDAILGAIEDIHASIIEHTVEETRVFGAVLDKIPPADREALLRDMQSI